MLGRGWIVATRGAVVAALLIAALGQVVAFLGLLVDAFPKTSAGQTARYGWALFYLFHHVGMVVRSPSLRLTAHADEVLSWPSGYAVDAVVALALLSGTALVAWLLVRAGRRVGEYVGGPELRRAIHGAKVAVPYALLSWVAAWGLSIRVRLPDASPAVGVPIASGVAVLAPGLGSGLRRHRRDPFGRRPHLDIGLALGVEVLGQAMARRRGRRRVDASTGIGPVPGGPGDRPGRRRSPHRLVHEPGVPPGRRYRSDGGGARLARAA